jgi:hypothetical protein
MAKSAEMNRLDPFKLNEHLQYVERMNSLLQSKEFREYLRSAEAFFERRVKELSKMSEKELDKFSERDFLEDCKDALRLIRKYK